MYTLKEAWVKMYGSDPIKNWQGKIHCMVNNGKIVIKSNQTRGLISAYAYNLVTKGWMISRYGKKEVRFEAGDINIYSPGLDLTVVECSEDYEGICLFADESMLLDTVGLRDMVQISYFPVIQQREPKLSLSEEAANRILKIMLAIRDYEYKDHSNREEIIRHFYVILLLELQYAQQYAVKVISNPKRVEQLFINFIRLLPSNFIDHHDISFYAKELNVSPTYLSRIVRQVTGNTVMHYINQFLIIESNYLLTSTTLSIGEIAERLHFSDTASFSKFYLRLTGKNPKNYRSQVKE